MFDNPFLGSLSFIIEWWTDSWCRVYCWTSFGEMRQNQPESKDWEISLCYWKLNPTPLKLKKDYYNNVMDFGLIQAWMLYSLNSIKSRWLLWGIAHPLWRHPALICERGRKMLEENSLSCCWPLLGKRSFKI